MDAIKDGGQAFPLTVTLSTEDHEHLAYPGMTLRDYFAARALAALINHPNKDGENCGKQAVPKLAEWAYEYADAMLKAREAA